MSFVKQISVKRVKWNADLLVTENGQGGQQWLRGQEVVHLAGTEQQVAHGHVALVARPRGEALLSTKKKR